MYTCFLNIVVVSVYNTGFNAELIGSTKIANHAYKSSEIGTPAKESFELCAPLRLRGSYQPVRAVNLTMITGTQHAQSVKTMMAKRWATLSRS